MDTPLGEGTKMNTESSADSATAEKPKAEPRQGNCYW